MSTLLCPLDFHDASFQAAKMAAIIAKSANANLIYLHASNTDENEVHDRLVNGMEKIGFNAERLYGEGFRFLFAKMDLIDAIRQTGELEDIGLVVTGTNGITSLEELYHGTHSENMAGQTPFPVLILPDSFNQDVFKRIVFAVDYESSVPVDTESLLLLAEPFGASVHILHVSKEDTSDSRKKFENFSNKMRTIFGVEGKLVIARVVSPDTEEAILEYALDINADLIAIHKDHFSPADGSKTSTFTRMSALPVLVLKN
jgi:nucleotide-binding universal stress UspA family protein